jgi:hypothetical protein
VERVGREVDRGELLVGDLDLLRVLALVESRVNLQAGAGRCRCDRVDDDGVADQRPTAPGLADVAEQPVLDLG